jgi:hypothetical protein
LLWFFNFFAIIFLILEKILTIAGTEGTINMRNRTPEINVDLYSDIYGSGSGDDVEELLAQGYQINDLYEVGLLEDDNNSNPKQGVEKEYVGPQPISEKYRKLFQDMEDHPEEYPLPF